MSKKRENILMEHISEAQGSIYKLRHECVSNWFTGNPEHENDKATRAILNQLDKALDELVLCKYLEHTKKLD